MPARYETFEEEFGRLIKPDAELRKLATGFEWAEGPCWFSEGQHVVWSDIPNDRMLKWSAQDGMTVFRQPCNYTNGHTRDREGRLVSCEHGGRRVSRTEPDGRVITVVDNYKGKRLNSPNDVVVKSDDTIWFTDPPYGILSNREGHQAESELGKDYVFRFDPRSGELRIVADDFDKPNGIAFSPDEKVLYVADTGRSHRPDGPHHIRAFDVGRDGKLSNSRVFADVEPGIADGFRTDIQGNVWTSAGDGIHVYSAAGVKLGKIHVPERAVSNCTFGGPNRTTLFITATTSLYSIEVSARGAQMP
ncbi:MAG: SMP-30/gluconolactonase/LRE family protein [Chloroflexi bacterium]|nr:SMP-30/gluconolactonase/LRE family protein [Chloroflexota bacterium]